MWKILRSRLRDCPARLGRYGSVRPPVGICIRPGGRRLDMRRGWTQYALPGNIKHLGAKGPRRLLGQTQLLGLREGRQSRPSCAPAPEDAADPRRRCLRGILRVPRQSCRYRPVHDLRSPRIHGGAKSVSGGMLSGLLRVSVETALVLADSLVRLSMQNWACLENQS